MSSACPRPQLRRIDLIDRDRTQRCPRHVGEQAEDSIEIDRARGNQSVRQQMQPQVDISGINRRGRKILDHRADSLHSNSADLIIGDRGIKSHHVRWGSAQAWGRVPSVEQYVVGIGSQAKAAGRGIDRCWALRRHDGYRTCVSTARLDLTADVADLTAALVDIPSESGDEQVIADAVEQALSNSSHLTVQRLGNAVIAQTNLDHAERVVIAGHLDTVPAADNLPSSRDGDLLFGLGSCDMKGGVAVALSLAAELDEPNRDVTWVFYDCEEVDAARNGLRRIAAEQPELLTADFAILMEPTDAGIEAGCQGTLRAEVRVPGKRAHSARSWKGENAVHRAAEVLNRLVDYSPEVVEVDGLSYREGVNAVGITGGIAGNVIPDEAVVTVNYRYAPSRSPEQAVAHVAEVFDGFEVTVVDHAPGALPGLELPAAREFIAAVGEQPRPKFGWTDVARFSELGIPAVNFGPGDPSLAHAADEHVPVEQIRSCHAQLRQWLS